MGDLVVVLLLLVLCCFALVRVLILFVLFYMFTIALRCLVVVCLECGWGFSLAVMLLVVLICVLCSGGWVACWFAVALRFDSCFCVNGYYWFCVLVIVCLVICLGYACCLI